MSYQTQYIDIPQLKTRKGGKDIKEMSKTTNAEAPKAPKKYQKTRGEHAKDILIAVLITGIIAFVGGMVFQGKQQNAVNSAVRALSPSVEASSEGK